jgi:ceramide glucosyltransferase
MTGFATAVLAGALFASAYQLAQLYAAHRFFRRARRASRARARHCPAVTILKPLKGQGLDLERNLESFCRQDYDGPVQIVFGVNDPDDPAVEIVRRIQHRFPDVDTRLSVGDEPGANRKVANLVHMMRVAKHDVLVLSDADIRVRPDYLRTMVAPLGEPGVGLTTALYRGRGWFGLPSVIESLLINTDFIPMVMMAQWVQRFRYAYGASIACRRRALDDIGGFAAIADHLADDYELGRRIADAGWQLVLLPYVVETILDSTSLRDVWRHQLRWGRTYRVCQPAGWFFSILTHTTAWAVLAVVVTRGALAGWAALAIALACRLGALRLIMRQLRERETPRHLWMVPLKDLGFTAVWVVSWLGREVVWSGQRLRVEQDGRMVSLTPPAAAPATTEPCFEATPQAHA